MNDVQQQQQQQHRQQQRQRQHCWEALAQELCGTSCTFASSSVATTTTSTTTTAPITLTSFSASSYSASSSSSSSSQQPRGQQQQQRQQQQKSQSKLPINHYDNNDKINNKRNNDDDDDNNNNNNNAEHDNGSNQHKNTNPNHYDFYHWSYSMGSRSSSNASSEDEETLKIEAIASMAQDILRMNDDDPSSPSTLKVDCNSGNCNLPCMPPPSTCSFAQSSGHNNKNSYHYCDNNNNPKNNKEHNDDTVDHIDTNLFSDDICYPETSSFMDFKQDNVPSSPEKPTPCVKNNNNKDGDNNNNKNNRTLMNEFKACFDAYCQKLDLQDCQEENTFIETFVTEEQILGRQRRSQVKEHAASEEVRLAAEIARLKAGESAMGGKSLNHSQYEQEAALQRKIGQAERAYINRKMVFSKASQLAAGECRWQFARVRGFLEQLHQRRLQALRRQHLRSVRWQTIWHRLQGTDPRVVTLERHIAHRLYDKQVTDWTERHLAQNLEEAVYLEAMLDSLDRVQAGKECAARELLELHVAYLQAQSQRHQKRQAESEELIAKSSQQMAQVVAMYVDEAAQNDESSMYSIERMYKAERQKAYDATPQHPVMSVSQLYDTVLWSVATTNLGLSSSSESFTYLSDFDLEEENGDDGDEEEDPNHASPEEQKERDEEAAAPAGMPPSAEHDGMSGVEVGKNSYYDASSAHDTASVGSTTNTNQGSSGLDSVRERLSPLGNMHIQKLSRELRRQKIALLKRHEEQVRREGREHHRAVHNLKRKHSALVQELLQQSVVQRQTLRKAIAQRMDALVQRQDASTAALRKAVRRDWQEIQGALQAETQRLQEIKTESFIKAQSLISAQVFHEVRNALSSVISMSDMTRSLKEDASVTPQQLVESVDDMLEQIQEIVGYSIHTLNNILDVNKITSGSFHVDRKPFNIEDLVRRATKMQMAKAGEVKMSFIPSPTPCIVYSDSDIVLRVVTNLISNAIKFTADGAVQPFVWKVSDLMRKSMLPTSPEGAMIVCDDPQQTKQKDWNKIATAAADKRKVCSLTREVLTLDNETESSIGTLIGDPCETAASSSLGAPTTVCDDNYSKAEYDARRIESDKNYRTRCIESDKIYSNEESDDMLIAVGVADTGSGLSAQKFEQAEADLSNPDARIKTSGVMNSGFGLHLAHLLTKAIGSKLELIKLEQCRHLLNDDMINALDGLCKEDRNGDSNKMRRQNPIIDFGNFVGNKGGSDYESLHSRDGQESGCDRNKSAASRNSGTVIFFRLPLHDSLPLNSIPMQTTERSSSLSTTTTSPSTVVETMYSSSSILPPSMNHDRKYHFSPRPSPTSIDGTFRLLVADDVLMLRKGLVHTLASLFPECPISICTSCSAEDFLRAVSTQPFDMVICDNEFRYESASHKPLMWPPNAREGEGATMSPSPRRPYITLNDKHMSAAESRRIMKDFFDHQECFTIEDGDGILSGFDAIMQLAVAKDPPFTTPVLMILSGHKFEVSDGLGIIVAEKPLKRDDFIPLLEDHAHELVSAALCIEGEDGGVYNRHGSRIFVSSKC